MRPHPTRCRTILHVAPLALVALGACHHARAVAPAPLVSEPIGESARMLARIVRIDAAKAQATFELSTPAYVTALSVRPGSGVALIWTTPQPWVAGSHTTPVPTGPAPLPPQTATQAYNACMQQQSMRAPATRRVRRTVQRDEKGRPVDGGPDYVEVEIDGRAEATRVCGRQMATPTSGARTGRTPTDGYLLLLASTSPLSPAAVRERLRSLTVRADDLRGAMTAIGDGIYVDRAVVWSGAYVHW